MSSVALWLNSGLLGNKEADMTQKKVPCEVYSRIVGYLRPVQNWNKGKRQEFEDRRTYDVAGAAERECTSKAG